jgi:hypothetical protein
MDVIIQPAEDAGTWTLTDLLGRSMGVIVEQPSNVFVIRAAGNAEDTMAGMKSGPYGSLDQALAAIETHTRGVCRRAAETRSNADDQENRHGQP